MSILLVEPPQELGSAVVAQLIEDGDEVRVIVRRRSEGDAWRELGAHVALGEAADEDLVERAALNVRTVVLLEWEGSRAAATEELIEAVRRDGVDRIVVTAKKEDPKVTRALERAGIDYVVLLARRKLLGASPEPAAIARAVSAADDLAGTPRLVIDLADPAAWEELRLSIA